MDVSIALSKKCHKGLSLVVKKVFLKKKKKKSQTVLKQELKNVVFGSEEESKNENHFIIRRSNTGIDRSLAVVRLLSGNYFACFQLLTTSQKDN